MSCTGVQAEPSEGLLRSPPSLGAEMLTLARVVSSSSSSTSSSSDMSDIFDRPKRTSTASRAAVWSKRVARLLNAVASSSMIEISSTWVGVSCGSIASRPELAVWIAVRGVLNPWARPSRTAVLNRSVFRSASARSSFRRDGLAQRPRPQATPRRRRAANRSPIREEPSPRSASRPLSVRVG